jgi:hypothetical protein
MRERARAGASRWRICDINWQYTESQKHQARHSVLRVNIRRTLPGRWPPAATVRRRAIRTILTPPLAEEDPRP